MSAQVSRIPFTACIITKNEELDLPACLESVAFADEIIVVDSHSTDRTRDVAAAFRGRTVEGSEVLPRVIERDWPGHVEQKNFAVDQATTEWVLAVDADERVSAELRQEILAILSSGDPPADGYTVPRKTRYLGRWILGGGWYPDRKLRLFRKSRARWGGTNPHDRVQTEGKVVDLRGELYHFSYRDISDHVRTINFFTDIAAEEKIRRRARFAFLRMLIQPPCSFFKSYVLKRGFREGVAGFIVAVMGMFYVFLKYAKLWERTAVRKDRDDGSSGRRQNLP